MFSSIQLKLHPDRYFGAQEYILADSAYKASRSVVPAYKENDPNSPVPFDLRRRFNKELSRMRVTIEHTIGMLKSRFASLRGLRHLVGNKRTFSLMLLHIRACVVLHNMLVGQNDDTYWDDFDMDRLREEWESEAEELRTVMNRENPTEDYSFFTEESGEDTREALRYIFQHNGYTRPYAQDNVL